MADCAGSLTPTPRSEPHFAQVTAKKTAALTQRGKIGVLLVGDSLVARWPRDLAPKGSFNFGVGGDRTENVLWRLENARLPPADRAVILVGTNNLRRDEAACIADGILAIAQEIATRSKPRKTVVIGILPRRANAKMAEKIVAVNRQLAAAAGQYRFLDLSASFNDAVLYLPDGIHLSRSGYETLATTVNAELQQ